MIDKSGEYWHLYFSEQCAPNPGAIRKTVQKLFDEMSEMGDVWLVRAKPTIDIVDDFEGDPVTRVYCRFSAKPSITMHGTSVVAIGLSDIQPIPMPIELCPKCRQWYDGNHVCLTLTVADLKRELSLANTLLAQRNALNAEQALEIQRLRAELDVVCEWARAMADYIRSMPSDSPQCKHLP